MTDENVANMHEHDCETGYFCVNNSVLFDFYFFPNLAYSLTFVRKTAYLKIRNLACTTLFKTVIHCPFG